MEILIARSNAPPPTYHPPAQPALATTAEILPARNLNQNYSVFKFLNFISIAPSRPSPAHAAPAGFTFANASRGEPYRWDT